MDEVANRIIAGKDKRTIAHEFGHSAGLPHVGLPEDMNNLMMQSCRIQDVGKDPSKATFLNNGQINLMMHNYINDKINKVSPVRSFYLKKSDQMKQTFLLLLLICLLLSCNSRKGKVNSEEVFVFLRMDYEGNNKTVAKLWINDTLKFSKIYFSDLNKHEDALGMRATCLNKTNSLIKFKVQFINIDKSSCNQKQYVDTTFHYSINNIDEMIISYTGFIKRFKVYNNRDNPEYWISE